MLNLIITILLLLLILSAVEGLIAFACDVHQFKQDIEFSGSRKQLIEYLLDTPEKEDKEVTEDDTHND